MCGEDKTSTNASESEFTFATFGICRFLNSSEGVAHIHSSGATLSNDSNVGGRVGKV
jgi:hypothetical protein